jgi:hypothetical protein
VIPPSLIDAVIIPPIDTEDPTNEITKAEGIRKKYFENKHKQL